MIAAFSNSLAKVALVAVQRSSIGSKNQVARFLRTSAVFLFDPINYEEAKKRLKKKNTKTATKKELVQQKHVFDSIPADMRTKENFENAISLFRQRNVRMRGHVDFILAALKRMKDFKVHEDLEVYKKLVSIFPTETMKVQNTIQAFYQHYPRHQDCCIILLDQMGFYMVHADKEFYKMVEDVFGNESHVMLKLKQQMYWMPKFRYADPNPVPKPLPNSDLELAKIIINRICRDPGNVTKVFFSESIEGAKEDTWLVSGQSPLQIDHILRRPKPLHFSVYLFSQPVDQALYIDGPFRVWAGKRNMSYFTLSAEPNRQKHFGDIRPDDHNWHTAEEWETMDNKYQL